MISYNKFLIDVFDVWLSAEMEPRSGSGKAPSGIPVSYGIGKYKELMFNLAFCGRLVSQRMDEGDALDVIKEINEHQGAKLKKKRAVSEISDSEKYLDIPVSWAWIRLGETGVIFNGNSISESEKLEKYTNLNEGLPFIATKDVGYGDSDLNYENGILIPFSHDKFKVAHAGAVLICSEGGSAGKKIGITDRSICFGNKLIANEVWDCIAPKYIYYFYQTSKFFNEFSKRMTGIIGGISLNQFLNIPIPIPPYQEQLRIISRLDQVVAMSDELDCQRLSSEKIHKSFRENLLKLLLDSKNSEDFLNNWSSIYSAFDIAFKTAEDFELIKLAILKLAVTGKLVQQDELEESAIQILQKISSLKPDVFSGQKSKKEKNHELSESTDFIGNKLPSGWTLTTLQNVYDVRDGTHDTPKYVEIGYPLVTSKNLYSGKLDFTNIKFISESDHLKVKKRSEVNFGDVLFAMIGTIGNPVIVETREEFSIKNVALFKPYSAEYAEMRYLLIYLKHITSQIKDNAAGAVQSFVSLSTLRNYPFPLPPLAEQKRIVKKVDELFCICDQLQSLMECSSVLQRSIADLAVESALA